jgi:hypothetical protein
MTYYDLNTISISDVYNEIISVMPELLAFVIGIFALMKAIHFIINQLRGC